MKRYDLNLMTALDALLEARSVSRAARMIGVGQPAMSAALSRLRALFDDPLLVRGPRGMEPTPRAIALTEPLRAALGTLASLVEPQRAFDPARAEGKFCICGGDYAGMVIMPPLFAIFQHEAPNVDMRFRFVEKDDVPARLDSGEIDLALLVTAGLPPRFAVEPLFEERLVCVVRANHPALAAPINAQRFAGLDHLLVTERGDARGRVDDVLETMGLKRRVALTVPSTALVEEALREADLVATIPWRAAARIAASGTVRMFEPPIDAGRFTMSMAWLVRSGNEPASIWLRAKVRAAATKAGA